MACGLRRGRSTANFNVGILERSFVISTIFLSDDKKGAWLEACDAGLSPSEFLADMRLRLLNKDVREMNEVDAGLTAYIDEDGDIAYQVTDPEKQYAYYKSINFPRSHDTPELLVAHLAASALSEKENRKSIREVADWFRRSLSTEYPRLADVPLDIIPASHINAWAQPVPGGGDAVGLNKQFITRCWVWCDWFIWLLETPGSPFLVQLDVPEEHVPSWSETQLMLRTTNELAKAMMGISDKQALLSSNILRKN